MPTAKGKVIAKIIKALFRVLTNPKNILVIKRNITSIKTLFINNKALIRVFI